MIKQKSTGVLDRLLHKVAGKSTFDAQDLNTIEEALLRANLGVDVCDEVLASIQKNSTPSLREALESTLLPMLSKSEYSWYPYSENRTHCIAVIGVNGVGKTTTIGKIGKRIRDESRSVMAAAGDTFRAAAKEQLIAWGNRYDVPIVSHKDGADSAAVVFDAMDSAKAKKVEVLLIDTAGRLHNKSHLADELKRIMRTIEKKDPQAPDDVFLVLDAKSGQNVLTQIEAFSQMAPITGLIFTKTEHAQQSGIIIAAAKKYPQFPIIFLGTGEGVDDLKPFVAAEFVQEFSAFCP